MDRIEISSAGLLLHYIEMLEKQIKEIEIKNVKQSLEDDKEEK